MASVDVDLGRPQKDIVRRDAPLRNVLARVDQAFSRTPPQPERDHTEFGPPHARPPRVSPDAVLAEFETHARSCEDILAEIRTMLKTEEQSWERLAVQYRELGQVQAEAVHNMLARIATMREVRTRLSNSIGPQS